MAPCFPTQFEFRVSGVSLILATICWTIAFWTIQIDHNLYKTATNESVISLHETISTPQFRQRVEIACVFIWISLPLMLAAIHGISKLSHVAFYETPGEVLIYMFEKSFILLIGIGTVFFPALMLTAVSFDWNYEEIGDDGRAPSGYWIQSYLIIYSVEIIDCLAICDAVFMLSYFGLGGYWIYVINKKDHRLNQQYTEFDQIVDQNIYRSCRYCIEILTSLCCCSLFIVFLFILFQFAESGFFSPNEDVNAGMLFIWSFLVKIIIGFRYISMAKESKYHVLEKVFGGKHDHGHNDDKQPISISQEKPQQYHMNTIDVEKGDANQ